MFTLHNGDCLQVMPSIPSGSIDAIITDLPYGTTACEWDSIIPLAPMWEQVKRVLKANGAFITTASQPFTSVLIMSNLPMFRHDWVWNKVAGSNFGNVNYSPFRIHESVLCFSSGVTTFNHQFEKASKRFGKLSSAPSDVTMDAKGFRRDGVGYPKSIQQFMRPNNLTGGGLHPTQKPIELYRYLIRTYTNEGETVLDICMGSGTTIEAAEIEGRNSIGIEKEIGYFQVAEKRAKSAVLQQRLFTPSNTACTGRLDSSATQSSFTAEGIPPAKARGAKRRQ